MTTTLRSLGLASTLALAPLAASAATLNPGNNIAPGEAVDLLADSYFFEAEYEIGEAAGSYIFSFENTSDSLAAVTFLGFDTNQNTAAFEGGLSFTFGDDIAFSFPQGAVDGQAFTTLVAAGATSTLTVGWGQVLNKGPRGGNADFSFSLEAAVVPLPASGLLLLGALGGVAVLRRRKAG